MQKNLIVTLNIGNKYNSIAKLTHPTLKNYADKIGADFIVLDKQQISKTSPQWEKYRIFDLLNKYRRILYFDTDLIIREDCPNLFSIVPEENIGLFDESPFTDRQGLVQSIADYWGKKIEVKEKYYNTGVMVVSRKHKYLFVKPEQEIDNFYEQTYFNMQLAEAKEEVFSLNYNFNRMSCIDRFTGISRLDAYIIHYAGCPTLNLMQELIVKDLDSWEKDSPNYKYKQRVLIKVSGGLGDQLNAQPAIRFMKNKVLPETEINITTHYPTLFKDINGINIFSQEKFVAEQDTPYRVVESFPPPSSTMYSIVGNLLCHTVDYCSMALLKRTLPFQDKNIKLNVTLKDLQKVIDVVGITDLRELILIHPGKHWDSKTMPYKWWEEIIDGLVTENIPVCIIGKTAKDDEAGVWNFEDRKGVLNLVNLLDLDGLIALISQAKVLVSNDSSPVHIAGAFDNWIIVIPTVKHPDHILPFRNSSTNYKTDALYRKLVLDDYSTSPFELNEITVDKLKNTWDNYLVSPKHVVEVIKKRYLEC
jgi:hypothetical protein